MRLRLGFALLLLLVVSAAQAYQSYVVFNDPAGDSPGPIDVVGLVLSFDHTTGGYTLLLLADPSGPFQGDFRVNVNLYNPDTDSTSCATSFFQDNMNDYVGFPASTTLVLAGADDRLRAWDVGDRVATNSTPFGNPDCSTLFHSAAAEDRIADGDTFSTILSPIIFVDGFESGDLSAWSYFPHCPGCPSAGFIYTTVGRTVTFLNQSTGTQPLSYSWDFGDGTPISTQENPQHTYSADGTYQVRLVVSNSLGTDTVTKSVTVGS